MCLVPGTALLLTSTLWESWATLARHNVALASITENIDYSTAHGRLLTTMLTSFAEFFSDSLGTHVKKGISERAQQGKRLGGIPFDSFFEPRLYSSPKPWFNTAATG